MNRPSAERKAAQIANEFLDAELESDAEAKAWLVEKSTAAFEKAEEGGCKEETAPTC